MAFYVLSIAVIYIIRRYLINMVYLYKIAVAKYQFQQHVLYADNKEHKSLVFLFLLAVLPLLKFHGLGSVNTSL